MLLPFRRFRFLHLVHSISASSTEGHSGCIDESADAAGRLLCDFRIFERISTDGTRFRRENTQVSACWADLLAWPSYFALGTRSIPLHLLSFGKLGGSILWFRRPSSRRGLREHDSRHSPLSSARVLARCALRWSCSRLWRCFVCLASGRFLGLLGVRRTFVLPFTSLCYRKMWAGLSWFRSTFGDNIVWLLLWQWCWLWR